MMSNGKLMPLRDRSIAPNPRGAGTPKREKFQWDDLPEPGEFMWVNKTDLHIDHSYQRELKSSQKVIDIAKKFDWMRCGVLRVVLRPDGRAVIVDGQHRGCAALLRDDIESLPCIVFEWDSLSDEARAFVEVNTMQARVGAWHRHRAGLVSQDPTALAAERVVRDHGYEFTATTESGRTIKAVSLVHRMVQKDEDVAAKTVELAADMAAGEPLKAKLLGALHWIGERDPDLFSATHRNRLRELGPDVLLTEIERHRMIVGKGGAKVYAEAVLKLLNKGRRSNRLCES